MPSSLVMSADHLVGTAGFHPHLTRCDELPHVPSSLRPDRVGPWPKREEEGWPRTRSESSLAISGAPDPFPQLGRVARVELLASARTATGALGAAAGPAYCWADGCPAARCSSASCAVNFTAAIGTARLSGYPGIPITPLTIVDNRRVYCPG